MSTTPLLEIEDLSISYHIRGGVVPAVQGVTLTLEQGELLAVVGESGSGKSTLAQSLLGLLPANGHVTGGSVRFHEPRIGRPDELRDLTSPSDRAWRSVRGRLVGLVPQDPTVSLNPVQRIGPQIAEVLRTHGLADRRTAAVEAIALLDRAGLSDPAARARQYPHELSGGMRQRVLIAIATAASPRLIVADEPTSALDATVARRILDHLDELRETTGTAILLVTHDLGIAADRADRVVVMSGGKVVEQGRTAEVLSHPADSYTRTLLAAAPALRAEADGSDIRRPLAAAAPTEVPLLRVTGLTKEFRLAGSVLRAVDDVTFDLRRHETLALVGESGSGKSTTARLALRLADPTSGTVEFDGTDITTVTGTPWRELRRRAQLIYQNPFASLDPRFSVADIVAEPLQAFKIGDTRSRAATAAELIERVALPRTFLERKPVELSGGQRQRVAIARALALSPDLVVCDEPVSALDVSVQGQVLDLLRELQDDLGLSYLFISHDLAVVRQFAHRVAVMHRGRIVETGPTASIFTAPTQPYTQELIGAIAGTAHPVP